MSPDKKLSAKKGGRASPSSAFGYRVEHSEERPVQATEKGVSPGPPVAKFPAKVHSWVGSAVSSGGASPASASPHSTRRRQTVMVQDEMFGAIQPDSAAEVQGQREQIFHVIKRIACCAVGVATFVIQKMTQDCSCHIKNF
ncbi:hypothetical protein MTO96_032830 [Rhipicephalus appendiculatus]